MSTFLYLQPSNSYVVVHNLKTCTDGGILDLDDRITDVADDREQASHLLGLVLISYLFCL